MAKDQFATTEKKEKYSENEEKEKKHIHTYILLVNLKSLCCNNLHEQFFFMLEFHLLLSKSTVQGKGGVIK